MILTLEVASAPGRELPAAREFRDTGGTIGRSLDNAWVLPDSYVSLHHARIRFTGAAFQIEDTSTNGVFINSTENRLTRGKPYDLKSGDRILIDPYEIRVTIASTSIASTGPSPIPVATGADDVDPFSLLDIKPNPPQPRKKDASDLNALSPMQEHFRPPSIEPAAPVTPQSGSIIPDDWLETDSRRKSAPAGRPTRPDPTPTPTRPAELHPSAPAAPPSLGGDLAQVLAGAGLPANAVSPELARDFGQILRIVVEGLMDVLKSRQQIKDEFRMHMTSFKPSQNNPLKFSANVDDALHNLLVKRNPAYLDSVDAFEDAFEEIRNHQMAMLSGVRVAFQSMLRSFDPKQLQEEFERHAKGSFLSAPAKLRYWDQYKARFDDMVADADACFRELFGEEFAKAYEEQLERLKAEDRSGRPR